MLNDFKKKNGKKTFLFQFFVRKMNEDIEMKRIFHSMFFRKSTSIFTVFDSKNVCCFCISSLLILLLFQWILVLNFVLILFLDRSSVDKSLLFSGVFGKHFFFAFPLSFRQNLIQLAPEKC